MKLSMIRRQLAWFFCLLAVSGCASKLPRTVAVSGPDLAIAEQRFTAFFEQSCVRYVDGDVRLGWEAYGHREIYPATLLAAFPASLRFSVVDPLGRPLLLLAVNGNTFTFADNREAKGYTGFLNSDFIREYLPVPMPADDFFFWLSGRIPTRQMQILSSRRAEEGDLYWYELDYGDRLIHLVGLDRANLRRHLVLDEENTVLIEAQYSGYSATSEDCEWPGQIVVTGEDLAAEFSLDFSRLYSFSPLKQHLFQLQLPPHYTVQEVK